MDPKKPPQTSPFGFAALTGVGKPSTPASSSEAAGAVASLVGGAIGGAIGAIAAAKGRRSGHQVVLELSPQARAGLDTLLATGLFGRTVEDVAERLLMERMRDLVADGWIEVPAPTKAAAPAPARRGRRARR